MAGYLGASPVPQTIQKKESFTASAGQQTFNTTGYTDGNFINVFLNGVRLVNGTDYTATNGSDIVLASAASASDVLDFETFNEFTLVDQTLETPTFRTSATLKNDTHEDTDGGRASKLVYKGEQSGGEISTLAEIQASHDGTADDQKGDLIFKTNDGSDNNAPTEAARIDSGRNFLIGTTGVDPHNASSSSDVGVAVRNDGRVHAGANGQNALAVNRVDDGTIVTLKKAGGIVGTFGYQSTGFYVDGEGGHAGLRFAGNEISPRDNGADADDTVSLGESDKRFKNLYLSGGVVFGDASGSGVSSETLDDYEEGTWTPTFLDANSVSQAITNVSGEYTKIGNTVHAHSVFTRNNTTGTSGTMQIGGLPFAGVSSRIFLSGHVWVDLGGPSSGDEVATAYNGGGLVVYGVKSTTSSQQADNRYIQYQQVTNSRFVYMSLVYRTS